MQTFSARLGFTIYILQAESIVLKMNMGICQAWQDDFSTQILLLCPSIEFGQQAVGADGEDLLVICDDRRCNWVARIEGVNAGIVEDFHG